MSLKEIANHVKSISHKSRVSFFDWQFW